MKLKRDGSVLIGGVKVFPKWQWSDWYYKAVVDAEKRPAKWRHDNDSRMKQIEAWAMLVHGAEINFKCPIKSVRVYIDEYANHATLTVYEEDERGEVLEEYMSGYRWYTDYAIKRKGEMFTRSFPLPAWLRKDYVPVDMVEETVSEPAAVTYGLEL